ncbi:MAG: MFS transporter [Rhodospirillaceae bacterium]
MDSQTDPIQSAEATPGGMTDQQATNALGFSCVGHAFDHVFEPIFFVVALVLPVVFGLPFEVVLTLVLGGKLLMGLGAPLAGHLGDRWGAVRMMTIFFLGTGISAIAVGLTQGPVQMAIALGFLGLFAGIYHPVGLAWLVRTARKRGKALGINGAFGGFGPAIGGLGAGLLIDVAGWRSAFILPGVLCVLTGLAFAWYAATGRIVEGTGDRSTQSAPVTSRRDAVKIYGLITLAMLVGGVIYQATQSGMPKMFEDRIPELGLWFAAPFGSGGLDSAGLPGGAFGIGIAVAIVYGVAGCFQIVSGSLADRYSLRRVYIAMYLVQIPVLLAAAHVTGLPLILVMILAVCGNIGALPAENALLARYTPLKWRSTAYGLKFVIAFGISGLGVPLVAFVRAETGETTLLFLILGGLAALIALALTRLPGEEDSAPPEVTYQDNRASA